MIRLIRRIFTAPLFWACIAGLFLVLACCQVTIALGAETCGLASWYGMESCVNPHDCRTANGKRYTARGMTAAHRTLPFGTRLEVTLKGKSAIITITDRGPYHKDKHGHYDRVLDLSRAAAKVLGVYRPGVARVCWVRLS